jgi:hypothetical protein
MIEIKRIGGAMFAVAAMFAFLIATGATAQAQWRDRYDDRYGYGRYEMNRIAEENGYRDGVERGRLHRVERHSYDPRGTSPYKDGDRGYRREWNDKDGYKRVYRESFLRGYDAGYRGSSRDGGYRDDPSRRNDPYYGDRRGRDDDYRYGRSGRYDVYQIARENGHREGLRFGEEDRRNGDRYNNETSSYYRNGDSGYRSEYGDREAYRQGYREGFRRGYDEGYRRGSGGWGGGFPRFPTSRWPLPWPF